MSESLTLPRRHRTDMTDAELERVWRRLQTAQPFDRFFGVGSRAPPPRSKLATVRSGFLGPPWEIDVKPPLTRGGRRAGPETAAQRPLAAADWR